jgi:stage V sporulation protein R
MTVPMFGNGAWTNADIVRAYEECEQIAIRDEDGLKLDVYKNQLEIITSAQMLDAYSTVALPIMYPHWKFGKQHIREAKKYRDGQMGLAYEIVINSDPCIAYLMEENTIVTQCLVIAHASFGHNYVFKNNYMFKDWTDAEGLMAYLTYARDFVIKSEQRYGVEAVEKLLDNCHALQYHGVDRYRRPPKLANETIEKNLRDREELYRQQYDPMWRSLPQRAQERMMAEGRSAEENELFPSEPQENLLYFIEKYSPVLEPWQREIVRIVRKISQYFYPQMQTQVINEGAASFVHYFIMNKLFDKGLLTDGNMLEFIRLHTGVLTQYGTQAQFMEGPGGDKYLTNLYLPDFNPYWLGFTIQSDLKRICENPTEEDKRWFPEYAGKPWLPVWKHAIENFRDESFIDQFLSPKVMRDNRFFSIRSDSGEPYIEVEAIQDDDGFKTIRKELSRNYSLSNRIPEVYVKSADIKRSRAITLQHISRDGRMLDKTTAMMTLKHFKEMWGFPVTLESVTLDGRQLDRMIL